MSAASLLQHLQAAGLALDAQGDRVIVRPRSLLTDADREAIKANKAELLELLTGPTSLEPAWTAPYPCKDAARTCADCANRTRYSTCAEPVAAGLADSFTLIWPEPAHASTCTAWRVRTHATESQS